MLDVEHEHTFLEGEEARWQRSSAALGLGQKHREGFRGLCDIAVGKHSAANPPPKASSQGLSFLGRSAFKRQWELEVGESYKNVSFQFQKLNGSDSNVQSRFVSGLLNILLALCLCLKFGYQHSPSKRCLLPELKNRSLKLGLQARVIRAPQSAVFFFQIKSQNPPLDLHF